MRTLGVPKVGLFVVAAWMTGREDAGELNGIAPPRATNAGEGQEAGT